MMNRLIEKQTSTHYVWGDNCDSWVLVDTEGISVKQESMPSGTKEQLHFHEKANQFFFILKGTATFYIENVKEIVVEQKGIFIQAQTKHFIANDTPNSLEFLVISQPSTNNDRRLISV